MRIIIVAERRNATGSPTDPKFKVGEYPYTDTSENSLSAIAKAAFDFGMTNAESDYTIVSAQIVPSRIRIDAGYKNG
jgi:hypothetical protein